MGVVVEETNGNTKTTRMIQCGLNITEGIITLKIPPETGVQIASDAITIKNIIIEGENGVEIFKSEK